MIKVLIFNFIDFFLLLLLFSLLHQNTIIPSPPLSPFTRTLPQIWRSYDPPILWPFQSSIPKQPRGESKLLCCIIRCGIPTSKESFTFEFFSFEFSKLSIVWVDDASLVGGFLCFEVFERWDELTGGNVGDEVS